MLNETGKSSSKGYESCLPDLTEEEARNRKANSQTDRLVMFARGFDLYRVKDLNEHKYYNLYSYVEHRDSISKDRPVWVREDETHLTGVSSLEEAIPPGTEWYVSRNAEAAKKARVWLREQGLRVYLSDHGEQLEWIACPGNLQHTRARADTEELAMARLILVLDVKGIL